MYCNGAAGNPHRRRSSKGDKIERCAHADKQMRVGRLHTLIFDEPAEPVAHRNFERLFEIGIRLAPNANEEPGRFRPRGGETRFLPP